MATNASIRADRLRALVREERRALDVAHIRLNRRIESVEKLAELLKRDRELIAKRLAKFEDRLRELDEWRKEPVVLVRSTPGGYTRPVYHDAKNPCGFGENLMYPFRMLLAEAEQEGHRPCQSCGFQAKRRRIKAAA